MNHTPDNWIIFKHKNVYKILAGWSGGYITSDSWQVNSGIVSVTEDKDKYYFKGESGSVYECRKTAYGLRHNNAHIWEKLKEHCEMLPENTNWLQVEWKNE